jgi:hypothetical protein
MSAKVTLQEVVSTMESPYPKAAWHPEIDSCDLSHEMIGLSETPALHQQKTEVEKPFPVPRRFLKVLALVLALIAILALVAILAIDIVGMSGGPVLTSFDRYMSLIEVGAATGASSGLIKFFAR